MWRICILMLGCKGSKCRPSMTFCFFMFKSHRKQTTILDLRRILQKEIGSLKCGTTLMSNILLRKSYTTCVAFQLCFCNLLEIDAVVYCKVLCVCQKSFIETAPKINLVYFRWLMEVSNSCEVRLPSSFRVRP